MDEGEMSHPSATAILIVEATACSFGTGRVPGCPRQTWHTRVLGSPPKPTAQPQNILVAVASSQWISRPIVVTRSLTTAPPTAVGGAWGRAPVRGRRRHG